MEARLDAVVSHVLAHAPSEARLDAVVSHALIPVFESERAPLTIGALDVYPLSELAPVIVGADVYIAGTGSGVAGMPWIQGTAPVTVGQLWLQDGIASDMVVGGGWGLIVMINP